MQTCIHWPAVLLGKPDQRLSLSKPRTLFGAPRRCDSQSLFQSRTSKALQWTRRQRFHVQASPTQARDFQGPDALLFDCDGVLVDTEAEGHRIAFNKAFKEKGEVPSDFQSHCNLLQLDHMN